jgi:hypothetical protein
MDRWCDGAHDNVCGMSTGIHMPPIFTPPIQGRVVKIHRVPGHYAGEREAIVDIQLGTHILTLCAPEAGKIMRCRAIGDIVNAGDLVTELTTVGTPTWELFVSYRRTDAPGHAGRIGEALIRHLGPGQVFKDIESQEPGQDFVQTVRAMLQRAFCMVVIIGPNWASDQRLQDPDDLHREEIGTALQRGIQIIPALVNGAIMPRPAEVPEDIRPLLRRQAVEVTDIRWEYDTGRILETVDQVLADSPKRHRFLAQVPPWGHVGFQWVVDDPPPEHAGG